MQSWVHCRIYHKRCQGLLHSRRDGYQHLHLGLDGKGSGGAGYDCGVHDVMGCVGVMCGDGDQHLHFGLDGKGSGGAGYDCGVHDVMGCVGVMYGDGDQHLHFGLDGKGSGGAGYDCGVQDVMMVVLVLCAGTVISISILASMAREVEVRGTTAVCKKAIRKGQCPRLRTGACQANSYYLRLRHCSLYKHTYLQQQRSHQGRSVPQSPRETALWFSDPRCLPCSCVCCLPVEGRQGESPGASCSGVMCIYTVIVRMIFHMFDLPYVSLHIEGHQGESPEGQSC